MEHVSLPPQRQKDRVVERDAVQRGEMTSKRQDSEQRDDDSFLSSTLSRRNLAKALALCGCAAATVRATPVRAGDDPVATLQAGDRFAIIPDSGPAQPIKHADLKPGQAIMGGYPIDPATGMPRLETRLNMINVVRLAGEVKGDLAKTGGVAVFSAICTHKGCAVASWVPDANRWRCFCHMSEFDAADKGERVEGPATDPLPMVPIAVDAEGYIVATAGFTAPPGAPS